MALFLADGGLTQFTSFGNGLLAVGTIAGLLATALMCFMLILAARVPIIDATIGQDRAITLHSDLGHYVVYGVCAHAVFLTAGYASTDGVNLLAAFASLWDGSGDFAWACLGLGLLLVVSVSSILAVRRHYPYETWYVIHLITYAAVISSIPHQFSMSGVLAPGTLSRGLWTAMFLVTAFCLLAFRVFLPLYTSLEHRLVVSTVEPEGPDAVSLTFTGRRVDRLGAHGGHWFQWRLLTPGLLLQPHPFSLSAEPTKDSLRVTVRNLGRGTSRLQHVKPGTRVFLEGPYGMFTEAARTRDRVILAGAGIGIAPVRALLERLPQSGEQVLVIVRASTPDELYLVDEVRAICAARDIPMIELVGSRAGARWVPASHAEKRLIHMVPWATDADLYVCGPDPWMDSIVEDARVCGIPENQIHRESFDW